MIKKLRHIIGLAVFLGLLAATYWAWDAYPQLGRMEALRPWRGELTTWQVPIFVVGGFLLLSLLHWLAAKVSKSEEQAS